MKREKHLHQNSTNLQYIPINEKHIILGENWLRVEWNPSREVFVNAEYIFSYTGESISKIHVRIYGLLTKCEVKMAGYWPSSLFAFL